MSIILASASPRRAELLKMIGIKDFIVIPSSYEEENSASLSPSENVIQLALGKARNVAAKCGNSDIIIAADTLVYLDDVPMGKPTDKENAKRMLRSLSGRRHTVYTGVAVIKDADTQCSATASDVFFRQLSEREIDAYIATGEPMDKAGAYGAQSIGAYFTERIDGDFFNVMGLPVCQLGLMLKKVGVLIPFEKEAAK